MNVPSQTYLEYCLYFTANSLTRTLNKMADEEFMLTGLSPSHAFLQMVVNERPGMTQQEISNVLNFAPSTVTRFVDKLVGRGLMRREVEGKLTKVFATEKGLELDETIRRAWKSLYQRYCELLGEEFAVKLTADIHSANVRFGTGS